MPITVTPLNEAFPGMSHDVHRCHRFAHIGVEYLHACAALSTTRDVFGYNLHVELPLMHQAIELLLKAHAAYVDRAFSPRAYNHRTTSLLTDYEAKVAVFHTLRADPDTTNLLVALENAWLSVRYGESLATCGGSDLDAAAGVADLLVDAYFHQTGVPLQARHFPLKGRDVEPKQA